MAANPSLDYVRLAKAAKARRLELGMSRAAAANAAEVATNTYQRLEAGQPVRDTIYAKVETILGWASGGCMAVLQGADPAPANSDTSASMKVPEEDLSQAFVSAIVATSDALTAAEIREVARRVVEELKRRDLL